MDKTILYDLFHTIEGDKIIKTWFINEYANVYIDVQILYLDFLSSNKLNDTIETLLQIEFSNELSKDHSKTFIFNSETDQQLHYEMLEDLLDGEGESDVDVEAIKNLSKQHPNIDEFVQKLKDH